MTLTSEQVLRDEIEDLRRYAEVALERVEEYIVWQAEAMVKGDPHNEVFVAERNAAIVAWTRKRLQLAAAEAQLDDVLEGLNG